VKVSALIGSVTSLYPSFPEQELAGGMRRCREPMGA
jgi:hypothetical protein